MNPKDFAAYIKMILPRVGPTTLHSCRRSLEQPDDSQRVHATLAGSALVSLKHFTFVEGGNVQEEV